MDGGGSVRDAGTDPEDAGADAGMEPTDSGTDAGTDPTDAGPEPADGGLDAGATEDVVHVRRFTRYRTAAGIAERPEDFTRNPVELFVADGGALVPVPGREGAPGELVFAEVPRSTYYLKVGTTYVVTAARSIDLSVNRLGRPDIQTLPYPSTAGLELLGMDSWYEYPGGPFFLENPSSELQLVSEELGFMADVSPSNMEGGEVYVFRSVGLAIATGAMPRFEADRGDSARVVQLSPRELQGATLPDGGVQNYVAAVRTLFLPPFSHDGTGLLPIHGTMQPLPMQELSLDWKVSDFAAHAAEVNPAAVLRGPTFHLCPAAHGLVDGWFGYSGELLSLRRPLGVASDVSGTLTYGNPYPSDWGLVAIAGAPFSVQVRSTGGDVFRISAGIGVSRRVSSEGVGAFVPRILPPRALTLDGTEAYSSRNLSAGAHVLGWQPPSGASVSAYVVLVQHRIFRTGFPTFEAAARLQTDGNTTSVLLPAGVLQPGGMYYFTVRAVLAEEYAPDKPLMLSNLPEYSHAEALSGLLSTAAETQ